MNNYTKLRIKQTTAYIIVMTAIVVGALLFRQWVLSQYISNESPFWENIRSYYQYWLAYFQGGQPKTHTLLSFTLPIVLFFISFALVGIILSITFVLLRRSYKNKRHAKKLIQRDGIQNLIIDYLFDPKTVTFETLKNENKELVIDQLMILHRTIIGNKAEKVQKLFYDLHLQRYVAKQIDSLKWERKVKYLNVASAMDLRAVHLVVKKNINSPNWNVRDAAQLASLRLDKTYNFDFLEKIHRPMSEWQQTQMLHLIIRESIPVTQFSKFLNSPNPSIVIFCLLLMEQFNQRENANAILKLIDNKDIDIRRKVIHAIRILEIKDATPLLIERFPKESAAFQLGIIKALAHLSTKEAIDFICSILPNKKFDINFMALLKLSAANRKIVLDKIKWNSQIEEIVKHINNTQIA